MAYPIIPQREAPENPKLERAQYSALEHLSKALFVGRWRESVWAFMAIIDYSAAYFDETRVDDGSPFPVVAGFWNTYDMWELFEKKWRAASKHIPEHEFKKHIRVRPSENNRSQDEQRLRDAMILAEVMRDYTLWPIHVTIEKSFFQPIFDSVKKSDVPLMGSAYAVCSFFCCELLDGVAARIKLLPEWHPIKVVFDKGNADERWLEKGYKQYYSQKQHTYLKKTPLFEDDDELIPLRAADAYAWLLGRKYNHNEELEQLKVIHDPRHYSERQQMVITSEVAREIMTKIKPSAL